MQVPTFANMIRLYNAATEDARSFAEEEREPEKTDSFQYYTRLDEEIKREPHANWLLHYGWNGYSDQTPWEITEGASFDSQLVNIIIPISSTQFCIRGDNRRVILTRYPSLDANLGPYSINFASEEQLNNVRVLPSVPGKPLYGISAAFDNSAFEKLPTLKEVKGIAFQGADALVLPSSFKEFI
jgi:hypothetical protein